MSRRDKSSHRLTIIIIIIIEHSIDLRADIEFKLCRRRSKRDHAFVSSSIRDLSRHLKRFDHQRSSHPVRNSNSSKLYYRIENPNRKSRNPHLNPSTIFNFLFFSSSLPMFAVEWTNIFPIVPYFDPNVSPTIQIVSSHGRFFDLINYSQYSKI